MTCIIVDDEPLAREGLESFVNEIPFLELAGNFAKPAHAIDKIKSSRIDLLFLDIQMPKMSGLELLQSLKDPPATIISTAFSEYAIRSYELDVLDYLVKPVPFSRFLKAVNKARDFCELKSLQESQPVNGVKPFFFIKCDKCFEKIFYDELLFIEAMQNYVILQTEEKRFISYLTIKSVEAYLPPSEFLRISKSHIVSLQKIRQIRGNEVIIGSNAFMISRQNKDQVMKLVGLRSIRRS